MGISHPSFSPTSCRRVANRSVATSARIQDEGTAAGSGLPRALRITVANNDSVESPDSLTHYPRVFPYTVSPEEWQPWIGQPQTPKRIPGTPADIEPLQLQDPASLTVLRTPLQHALQPEIATESQGLFYYDAREHWSQPRIGLLLLLVLVAIARRAIPRPPDPQRNGKRRWPSPLDSARTAATHEPNPMLNPSSLIYLSVLSIMLVWLLDTSPSGWLRAHLPAPLSPERQTAQGCLLLWALCLASLLLWRLLQRMGLQLVNWLGNHAPSSPSPIQLRMQIPLTIASSLCLGSILLLLLPLNLKPLPWILHAILWLILLPDAVGIGRVCIHYFKIRGGQLHFFLYLCAVELVPYTAILTCIID